MGLLFLISFSKGRGNLDLGKQRVRPSYLDVSKHLDFWHLLIGVTEPFRKANSGGGRMLLGFVVALVLQKCISTVVSARPKPWQKMLL